MKSNFIALKFSIKITILFVMRKKTTNFLLLSLIAVLSVYNISCTGALDALNNLQSLKFKLGSVQNFSIAGVNISNIENPSNLNIIDAANLV